MLSYSHIHFFRNFMHFNLYHLLFFRMTAGYGGARSTSMGRIGSTVKNEATLFLLLLLFNPSLPRQVGFKTFIVPHWHRYHSNLNFLGPSLFSKCWVWLPQSLGLCCTWSGLSSYGDYDDHNDDDGDYDAYDGGEGGVMGMTSILSLQVCGVCIACI